jgi:hypothetical protein
MAQASPRSTSPISAQTWAEPPPEQPVGYSEEAASLKLNTPAAFRTMSCAPSSPEHGRGLHSTPGAVQLRLVAWKNFIQCGPVLAHAPLVNPSNFYFLISLHPFKMIEH